MPGDNRSGANPTHLTEDERVGRALNDYIDRRARGEHVSEAEFLARHRDDAAALAGALSALRAVSAPSDELSQLIHKQVLSASTSAEFAAELDHYGITGVIGRGGMGIVLRAVDQKLRRHVAIKVLRPELALDERAMIRFRHEAEAAAAIRHPHVVTLHAFGESRGTHYLVMELVAGESLADLIARGVELPTEVIRRILRELLEGLAAAHAAGLVHRDIKASNILLEGAGRTVKIADFGLARIATAQTRITMPQAAVGTPEYMSPEQARGDEDIDHHTDLYSAGVVLFEMLAGRVPFRADTSTAVIHAILHVEPPTPYSFRKAADRQLSSLALRLMAKRREDRFESAEEAMAALSDNRRIRVRSSLSARRWRSLAAVVVLAAASVFAGWMVLRSQTALPISATVALEPSDAEQAGAIRIQYADRKEPSFLRPFAESGSVVNNAIKVNLGARRPPIILASVDPPIERSILFALDGMGNKLWDKEFFSPWSWPDCKLAREFAGVAIAAADLDGRPGDEVVVVASDHHEYPTEIVVLDPHEGRIRAKYWHAGDINHLLLAEDLLGPGRPAILIAGYNNKLDGFDATAAADDRPVADFEYVPIVMILDPGTMSGERLIAIPALSHRMPDLPVVLPLAYAFLNVASNNDVQNARRRTDSGASPSDDEIMNVAELGVGTSYTGGRAARIVQVSARHTECSGPGVLLELNARLELLAVTASVGVTLGREREYWDKRYHVIVREGQIVPEYWTGYSRDRPPAEPD